jgi:phosphatidylglycerophosphatase A
MTPKSNSISDNISKDRLYIILGSAFGLGLCPFAPGTCGALLGVLIHIVVAILLPIEMRMVVLTISFLLICVANHLLTPWATTYWRSKDPSHFVLDEVAGYLLVPILFHHGKLWQIVFWGFLLFRILDIIKVPPARQIDRNMGGAWGILLDDLVSAGYAVLFLYVLMWIGPQIGLDKALISISD